MSAGIEWTHYNTHENREESDIKTLMNYHLKKLLELFGKIEGKIDSESISILDKIGEAVLINSMKHCKINE